jgi:hypothetical protein
VNAWRTGRIILTVNAWEGPTALAATPATRVEIRAVDSYRPRRRRWWTRRAARVPAYVALYVDGVPIFTGGLVEVRGLAGYVGLERLGGERVPLA